MTSRGTTETRPGEPGYSDRGQGSITPPDRHDRPPANEPEPDNPFDEVTEEDNEEETGNAFDEAIGAGQTSNYGWIDVVSGEVARSLSAWGKANGYSNDVMKEIYSQHSPRMFNDVAQYMQSLSRAGVPTTSTPDGLNRLVDYAIDWWGSRTGMALRRVSSGGGGGGRGRRGGGGASGPTAEDIRNRFDVEELTNGVNEMWRAMVFEENPQAKKLATQYVDAIVASKGEKKIDFATFVEEKIKETSRFKSIYRSKPEHLSPGEYMAPYLNLARQMAAPDDADDIAIQGAQFGAGPQDFQARLQREDSVTGSAPYINGLEARLSNLNKIFAGS